MSKQPVKAAVSAFAKASSTKELAPPKVEQLVAQYRQLEQQEQELGDQLSAVASAKNNIRQNLLVKALLDAGMPEGRLKDGTKVSLSQFVSGSLPKEPGPRKKALNWLRKHGAEALIVTNVELSFTKGESNMAGDAIGMLKEAGYNPSVEETVNTNTLQAFVREALKKGKKVDLQVLNLYAGDVARIGKPKESG